ncbi:MAG TPA: hypothetical protein VK206_04300 [Anaerolineales bacterium]|nr:hypothetical protein [Anaerolineales bacterium]HLO31799.1 hypothetical protein [Anaerolineales bacterium]
MADEIYFQWQNEVLLKTIYPLREMKLRDFLVYCKEIDLWAQYKDKKIEDFPAEVNAYIATRKDTLVAAYQSYKNLYAYFTQDAVAQYLTKYKLTDETVLAKVKALHQTLLAYLPKYADVRKEKYFVTQQVALWEQERKSLLQQIAQKQRRVNIVVPENQPFEKEQLQKLQVTFDITDEELDRLYAFVSSYNKIEKRKLEFYQVREAAQAGSKGAIAKLDDVHTRLQPVDAKQRQISADLARLRTPPSLAAVQGYLSTEDISNQIRQQFPQADQSLLNTINGIHKQLAVALLNIKDEAVKLVVVKNYYYRLQQQQQAFQREIATLETQLRSMPITWANRAASQARLDMLKGAGLQAIQTEIDKLGDYQAAFEYAKKSPAELAQMIQAKEQEMLGVQQTDSQLGKEASDLETQLKSLQSTQSMSEEDYLTHYSPDETITVKDIVRSRVEEYKASLAQKNHLELLEEIVQYFIQQPGRYPLWLQYMVIHFSGMRYATAHGSWADPKDLLMSLRTADMQKEFKKMDDDAIEALAQQRISIYQGSNGSVPDVPKLAQTQDQKWKDKIAFHLRGLKSFSDYYQRKALFDLRLDEENYEIETMTPTEALEELEAIKDTLPEWMWKEIVKLTDLRVKEVNDPNWEKLTSDEEEQRDEAQYAEFRAIMNKWKQDNLTGWREEHDRSDQLIVTRSVCNEVAEQIQHLRGYAPPGGLTPKAPWYIKNEHDATIPGTPRPYFVRPSSVRDYNVGASILWVRFVNELPNPWRVAHPLQTRNGEGLIPANYLRRASAYDWAYTQSDVVMRTRIRINEKKQTVREQQWLRWIHEATVAAVAETVDGTTILTFETALPYDDPRLSAVGVFKHDLYNLMFDGGEETYNGSFVGYLPEGAIPVSNLEEMLDWNHILGRQVMTPAELEDYRKKYIRKG